MAKLSRLATTITSHEVEGDNLLNTFYLDGRSNRFPQTSDLDITLDRSASGFYMNISSSRRADASRDSIIEKRQSLDKIAELIKDDVKGDIDTVINDMAENAIDVTGKFTLDKSKENRRPYFAGYLVKEGEFAAVTLGEASAFLYRDNILFPLTEDDLNFEAIDHDGNPVDNYNVYSAGRAGSIKYSNIAQLRIDDCIILATNNIFEVFGQEKFLRLLDEAYDQQETAELIHEYMLVKYPDEPYQFMMTFVEDVFTVKRRHKSDSFAERDTQASQIFSSAALEEYQRQQNEKDASSEVESTKTDIYTGSLAASAAVAAGAATVYARHENTVDKDLSNEDKSFSENKELSKSSDDDLDSQEDYKTAQKIEESEKNSEFASDMEFENSEKLAVTDLDEEQNFVGEVEELDELDAAANALKLADEDEEETDSESDDKDVSETILISEEDENDVKKKRRIFLVIILLVVIALLLLSLAFLLKNKKNSQSAKSNKSEVESSSSETTQEQEEETSVETSTEASTTTSTTVDEVVNGTRAGAKGGTYPDKYTIQWGDSFASIVNNVYGEAYDLNVDQATLNQVFDLIVKANPEVIPGSIEDGNAKLFAEEEISIPDPSDILKALAS